MAMSERSTEGGEKISEAEHLSATEVFKSESVLGTTAVTSAA